MPNLLGMHDEEGAHIVPNGGWCLGLVALSENSNPKTYDPRLNWLVRANWGYGSTGTIPATHRTNEYVHALGKFAAHSTPVLGYIIGNEPNHQQERPDGIYITPEHYADTYVRSYHLLKGISSRNRAIIAAPAPYHADGMPWPEYFSRMMKAIGDQVMPDGISFHAYARSMSPDSIYDTAKMGSPLDNTYAGFLVYRDFLRLIPNDMRHLPTYLTEFNVLPQWENRNTGVIQAAYGEINWWNGQRDTQKIHCLIPYRWKHDKWEMESKDQLLMDYRNSIQAFASTSLSDNVEAPKSDENRILMPSIKTDTRNAPSPSGGFKREIDQRALDRGVDYTKEVTGTAWRVKKIQWFNEQEADRVGPDHHILMDALDEKGNRLTGVRIHVFWPSGSHAVTTEAKPGELASANYPMSPSRNEYTIHVVDQGMKSEVVTGIGMGMETPGGFNAGIHTTTLVVFQKSNVAVTPPTGGTTPPKEIEQMPRLTHPVQDVRYRRVTQAWGLRPEFYSRYKVDGVPLRGHNGIDYGTPVGSNIVAVDTGTVAEVANDPTGYGLYVKLIHRWGESVYAHLSTQIVYVGQTVTAGHILGKSGNTGNSSGPHLHFGLRVNPFRRADGWGGYTDPAPYLEIKTAPRTSNVMDSIRIVALETGIEWELLASLAWAESSFKPEIQYGLFQVEDQAWTDFAHKVGAKNRNDALDNARVGAAYLKWLLDYFKQDLWKALTAYNFGIGNVIANAPVPAITSLHVNKILHGRDLLKAVLSG